MSNRESFSRVPAQRHDQADRPEAEAAGNVGGRAPARRGAGKSRRLVQEPEPAQGDQTGDGEGGGHARR